ncbi:polyketide synthase dehydratase domain-containing protein, partial [Nocardia sp. NPDC048505]|uniref:polyketide synthase dehydratase domain-containing protein n=1 Tax=Nocardia sp. NPDC048505 TaxID=3155756 RepID=UPI0033F8FE69
MTWPPTDARPVDITDPYERLREQGYEYGPHFRGLTGVWQSGTEVFAEAVLPTGVDVSEFGLHPALLDSVLHAIPLTSQADGQLMLPFSWSGVRLQATGATRVRARIRTMAPGIVALHLADAAGMPIATVDSLVLQSIPSIHSTLERPVAATEGLYEVRWDPTGSTISSGGTGEIHLVDISAVAGSASLFEYLRGSSKVTPDVVAVRCETRVDGADTAAGNVAGRVHSMSADLLRVLQAWLIDERFSRSRLVVVTRAAVATDECSVADLAGAAVWGLVASAQSEHPGRIVLIDSDGYCGAAEIASTLPAVPTDVRQIVLRGNQILLPKLIAVDNAALSASAPVSEPWLLGVTGKGTLDNVRLLPATQQQLGPGQVRIETRAIGLNFRDALIALDMYPDAGTRIGSEASGIVVEVGPGVTDYAPGDSVMGVFENHVGSASVTDHRLLARIPAGLTFAQAAAVPVAFATAYYGLFDLGQLSAQDSVLIHAATGGVGHAAVQLAKHCGAQIYATASLSKWGVLRSMGIDDEHLASSRTLDFEAKFRSTSSGQGVDVVLDALAGEFVDASMRLLPRGGRFIEMGKTDLRDPHSVASEYPGLEYRPFDLLDAGPDRIHRILTELVTLFDRGLLQPPPVTQWEATRASAALRHLSQARHIGKLVLTLPPPVSSGVVLVTGGTSGLGALIAQHLAHTHHIPHLVLT